MQRFGRIAKLREESAAAYDQLHEDVWPEVRAAVIAAGVCNYSIFRYKVWVFSYFELPEDLTLEAAFAAMSGCAICEQWEEKMRILRDTDFGADWLPMNPVFHENGGAVAAVLPEKPVWRAS